LEQLRLLASDPSLEKLAIYGSNSLAQLGRIAVLMLEGELDAMRGDVDAAAAKLSEAIAIDEGLVYSEPRDWPQPPRHSLGAILLEAGRAAEAEKVYQADLRVHRDNGWSLFGLWKSLAAQGKTEAAAEAKGRFEKAWSGADLVLTSSRL
jgi:tetratricopeptide (TPR) repeat protein